MLALTVKDLVNGDELRDAMTTSTATMRTSGEDDDE
jgi:hypothetical protein